MALITEVQFSKNAEASMLRGSENMPVPYNKAHCLETIEGNKPSVDWYEYEIVNTGYSLYSY